MNNAQRLLPPHSIESEQSVLGGLLWSNLNGHFDRVFSPRQGT